MIAATSGYRVLRSHYFTPGQFARAPRFASIADAVASMGSGVVIGDDGHLAAFHERHLRVFA